MSHRSSSSHRFGSETPRSSRASIWFPSLSVEEECGSASPSLAHRDDDTTEDLQDELQSADLCKVIAGIRDLCELVPSQSKQGGAQILGSKNSWRAPMVILLSPNWGDR